MFDSDQDDSTDHLLGTTDSLRQQVSALRMYLAELLVKNQALRARLLCAERGTNVAQPRENLQRALAMDCILAFGRFALGVGFLSAVADRFGLWGHYGSRGVAWGDFAHFLVYSRHLTSVLSVHTSNALGVVATIAEIALGSLLLLGLRIRLISLLSGLLLLSFGVAMVAATGPKSPLDASVFSAAAAALLLSSHDADRFTLKAFRKRQIMRRRA